MPDLEKLREEFIRQFFEPTFVDNRPYDLSHRDEEKIDWWLSNFSSYQEQLKERVGVLKKPKDWLINKDVLKDQIITRIAEASVKIYNRAIDDVLSLLTSPKE